ncbi:MAG: peptidase M61 [Burkholderiaceae bacterium]
MPSRPDPQVVGRKAAARTRAVPAAAQVHYRVEIADLNAHLYGVTLTIDRPAATQRLSLPVWIPGSYLVREFSRNLQQLTATQGKLVLSPMQIDKCTWEVNCSAKGKLQVRYEVYAFDNSVRSAWLDLRRGFFNGTSLLLRVHGQEEAPHAIQVPADKSLRGWQLATGLAPAETDANGFGTYQAADYDELVDSPVEMGDFWSGSFVACGVRHRLVVAGSTSAFDGDRLIADTQRICETQIRFWHGLPKGKRLAQRPRHQDYVFMLNAVDDAYGGLEHRNSTALICARRDLPRRVGKGAAPVATARPSDGYTTLLGLISHEYFHTWNVKRLRPVEFARYDYTQENYTQLLWFFEGFTSYYDDLMLRRAGLIDDAAYLKLLTKTLNQVLQTPGRQVQSVAQASFDAWVKYYRQDENTPNLTVSYYTKGAAVALCLDLALRAHGRTTLDAVMRGLWQRCNAGPMAEADLLAVLLEQTERDWSPEIARWAHSTNALPLKELLEQRGVAVLEDPAQVAQALGLRVSEVSGIQVKTVLRGGAGERAGFAAGDEWIGIENDAKTAQSAWRLMRLEELALYAAPASAVTALVARDRRLLRLPLQIPHGITTWRLAVRDSKAVAAWLGA